jgi:hypothetical protein
VRAEKRLREAPWVGRSTSCIRAALLLLLIVSGAFVSKDAEASPHSVLGRGAEAWADSHRGGIRGVTIGPIESLRHPGVGYGTAACARALAEARAMGATWVSLTPFGRVWDLSGTGIDLTFEAPFEDNREAVSRTVEMAHALGLEVLLVPHLWVETGGWRALIDPKTDEGWAKWAESYRSFLLAWADVARTTHVEMLSIGVELRSFVTTPRASLMRPILEDVRRAYPGLITYSANWDDVDDTLILDDVDLIGINAFYPLAEREGASRSELVARGREVAAKVERLSRTFERPVVLTEIGYTTRKDPALRPWEWPDGMKDVVVDERAQADAYAGIITPFLDAPWAAGFFVWRTYADPDDVSQEAEWGFSPRAKLAELILRDAFASPWASDGASLFTTHVGRSRARMPSVLGFDPIPR